MTIEEKLEEQIKTNRTLIDINKVLLEQIIDLKKDLRSKNVYIGQLKSGNPRFFRSKECRFG